MSQSTIEHGGARFRVEGTVQGVGFRWWTRDRAVELGLAGTVRNLPDGSVEVVAFGPHEALATLRRFIDDGPPSAEVIRVTEAAIPADTPPPSGFNIVR